MTTSVSTIKPAGGVRPAKIQYGSIQTFPTRRGFYAQINADGSVGEEHEAGEYWNRHEVATHANEAEARAAHEHYMLHGITIKECACKGEREDSVLKGGFIQTEKLSDGSVVYDVHMPDQIINCLDQKSALLLVEEIGAAIKKATLVNGGAK